MYALPLLQGCLVHTLMSHIRQFPDVFSGVFASNNFKWRNYNKFAMNLSVSVRS